MYCLKIITIFSKAKTSSYNLYSRLESVYPKIGITKKASRTILPPITLVLTYIIQLVYNIK